MKNKLLNFLGLLLLVIVSSLVAQQVIWPWLLQYPFFAQYRKEEVPVYITEKDEVYIQENKALERAVEKVESSIVGIRTITPAQEVLEGAGLVVTSDGLIVTLAELVPLDSDFSFYLNGELASYQILKRDLVNNLALIKLGENNLRTLSFNADVKLGERVFLLGFEFQEEGLSQVMNEGSVRLFSEELIQTNIFEQDSLLGSPLFDVEGSVVGLNIINKDGRVLTLPANKIRDFTGL